MKALIEHPTPRTLTKVYLVQHGLRYHFEGPLRFPGGITANVRTVWQIEGQPDLYPARFITLKPLRRLRAGP
jgi:hypothetical protein